MILAQNINLNTWIIYVHLHVYQYLLQSQEKKSCTDFGVYPWVKDFPILGNQVLLPSFCHVQLKDRILYLWLLGSSFIQAKNSLKQPDQYI
jgi:hypothetical protein